MTTKDDILRVLKEQIPEIEVRYKAREIGLFGSIVRGEQTETSDIDLLVDFEDDASLFDLVALADYLEAIFHRRVDIISRRTLRPELREAILQELVMP